MMIEEMTIDDIAELEILAEEIELREEHACGCICSYQV